MSRIGLAYAVNMVCFSKSHKRKFTYSEVCVFILNPLLFPLKGLGCWL